MTPNCGVNHPLSSVALARMRGVKQSGLGRDGAHQGLKFTLTKYVSVGP
jgi:acyl-CoA reductase-like NAD-dependent aldehyde dehydrogenase